MNQPDWMGGVRQIPVSQRRVEVRRMNGVNANGIGSHLGDERDPPLVGAVIGRELRRELAWKRGTEIHGLDPHRRPLTRGVSDFNDAPAGSRCNGCRRRSRSRNEHIWRNLTRNSSQIRERRRITGQDSQCPLETAARGDQFSRSICGHPRASYGVVRRRVNSYGPSEKCFRRGQPTLAHCDVARASEGAQFPRTESKCSLELVARAGHVVCPIGAPSSLDRLSCRWKGRAALLRKCGRGRRDTEEKKTEHTSGTMRGDRVSPWSAIPKFDHSCLDDAA